MKTMLIVNINPELEEDLVDFLLGLDFVNGFTTYRVRGHGSYSNMSLVEQVTGRRKRLQFEIILEEFNVDATLKGLREQVDKDVVYWQQAISNYGRFE